MQLTSDGRPVKSNRHAMRGATNSNVLTYAVFVLLAAAIVTFITIGYRTYKKDMYLSTTVQTIAMHDASQLQPTLYATKDPGDPVEKGTVTLVRKTSEPTASLTEKILWAVTAAMLLGVIAGFVMAAMGKWGIGKFVAGGAGALFLVLGCFATYETMYRETPYEVTLQPDGKGGAGGGTTQRAPVTFAANSSTPVKIKNVDSSVRGLKEGMKIQATLTREADAAMKIVSPIPEDKPKKAEEKKSEGRKGEITAIAKGNVSRSLMSLGEKFLLGVAIVGGICLLFGLITLLQKNKALGWMAVVVGVLIAGVGLGWGIWLRINRVPPYDITFTPEAKKDAAGEKMEPLHVSTDSSTTVKINGLEKGISKLKAGASAQVTLSADGKTVTAIESPVPQKEAPMLQLPAGFRGYEKRADPRYMSSVELKENYLAQSFTVSRGDQVFQVSQVNRAPLGFTAYARSLRLAALHDLKGAKMLEEGPAVMPQAKEVDWDDEVDSPLNVGGGKVNAYTLVAEGKDENGKLVRSRQIAIQGETTMMYVIKGTAPVADWPKIGEVFDSAISTFEIAAAPEEKPTPAATEAATQAAGAAEKTATAPAEATSLKSSKSEP